MINFGPILDQFKQVWTSLDKFGQRVVDQVQFGLGQNFFGLAHFFQGLIFVIEHQMKFEPVKKDKGDSRSNACSMVYIFES